MHESAHAIGLRDCSNCRRGDILATYLTSRRDESNSFARPPTRNGRALTSLERAEFESHLPKLFKTEAATMEELKNYSFRRDLRITILFQLFLLFMPYDDLEEVDAPTTADVISRSSPLIF
jgi:hypothetical protein